jgi:hypothetical protein
MSDTFHCAYSDGSIARITSPTREIWRYMDLGKLVSMLQHKALYFPVVAALGDELEAARPRLPEGSSADDQHKRWRSWNLWRCISFASCWHCASTESAAMWEIYAGRNQGIAIRSTLDGLSSAFPPAESDDIGQLVKGGFVEYMDPDFEEALPPRLSEKEVLRKRKWYSYEHEFRALCLRSGNWIEPPGPFEPGAYKTAGVWVHCDLNRIIEAVIVSSKACPYLEPAVREVLKRFGFNPELVSPSRLNEAVIPPNPTLVQEEWQRQFERTAEILGADERT